uniref:Uncharacterized protein n=1 Tax=Trypanosoma vivax (strain Y486) TaxID=1055687 RepID=G0TSK6_TRYVY|nr:hypothetical protein TVY486_0301230 [Trypanosoma vivax Y486]
MGGFGGEGIGAGVLAANVFLFLFLFLFFRKKLISNKNRKNVSSSATVSITRRSTTCSRPSMCHLLAKGRGGGHCAHWRLPNFSPGLRNLSRVRVNNDSGGGVVSVFAMRWC